MNNNREAWRPGVDTGQLRLRADCLTGIRDFFAQRKVMEVNTPLLATSGNTDPAIDNFHVAGAGYLRTSPEFFHKRLLAAGSGDIFELGPVFRRGEHGRQHQPEFLMLEWYRLGWHEQRLMTEVAELINHLRVRLGGETDPLAVEQHDYQSLFRHHLGLDPWRESDHRGLIESALENQCEIPGLRLQESLDWLLSTVILPKLPRNQLHFVQHFPPAQAALAEIDPGPPPAARRFELIWNGLELANGYRELTDSTEQARRFRADLETRRRASRPPIPVDRRLLRALEVGLPACAGVALGVDRLLMCLTGVEDIRGVLPFAGDWD